MLERDTETGEAPQPAEKASERADAASIRSVERALVILDTLAELGGEASLTEIAREAKLHVSTCHHLINTLVARGYVARLPGKRAYYLGTRILYLSHACLRQVDLPRRAMPHLIALNEATGEAVQLAVMQGTDLVQLLRRDGRHAVRVDNSGAGSANAAHATASGKAILAWLPEPERRRIFADKGLTRFTDKTITNEDVLVEQLRIVRRTGLAFDRQEFHPGVVCIGSAIRNHDGAVVGALSASIPVFRLRNGHVVTVQTAVLKAAHDLSIDLGAPDAVLAITGGKRIRPQSEGVDHAASRKRQNVP